MGRATVILAIFAFYFFIFVMFGLMGLNDAKTNLCSKIAAPSAGVSVEDCLQSPSFSSPFSSFSLFFYAMFFTIVLLPWWANIILFAPLGVTILWAIVEVVAVAVP